METDNMESMDYWLQRCSICFDNQLDFCLSNCRDQFCRQCFKRYVSDVVQNSWGINTVHVKCPVCQDHLSRYEWSRWVDPETIHVYDQYNRPFRSLTRHCHSCKNDVCVAEPPITYPRSEGLKNCEEVEALLKDIFDDVSTSSNAEDNPDYIAALDQFRAQYQSFFRGEYIYADYIYRILMSKIMDHIQKFEKSSGQCRVIEEGEDHHGMELMYKKQLASEVSLKLMALENRAEPWKNLQFNHVKWFPKGECSLCYSQICFSCGEPTHHNHQSCLEYRRLKIKNLELSESEGSPDLIQTEKWVLENSKPCPQCSVLINRDDGCNKMDCLFCGHRFCWVCQNGWSQKCGFYTCQTDQNAGTEAKKDKGPTDAPPEIGVPNVRLLEIKFSNSAPSSSPLVTSPNIEIEAAMY